MNKNLVNEILGVRKGTLQVLHIGIGFDFNADFEVKKLSGRFTLNSIKKEIGTSDLDGFNVVVLVLNDYSKNEFDYVIAYNSGFGLEFPNRVYGCGLYHFLGKTSFEERRKAENKTYYIIWQKKELAKPYQEEKIDLSERYTFVNKIGLGCINNPTKKGISQFKIKSRISGNKFNVKTINGFASTDINYFIDKSGYLIEQKKIDLSERTKKLISDRLKAEAEKVDFSVDIERMEVMMESAKIKISGMVLNMDNFESVYNAEKAIRNYRWALNSFNSFKKSAESKSFSSVQSAENSLENTIRRISEIFEEYRS